MKLRHITLFLVFCTIVFGWILLSISFREIHQMNKEPGNVLNKEENHFDGLPSITLTTRTASLPKLKNFLYCTFLRSTSLYWSKKIGKISLILDKESISDRKLAESLTKHQDAMGINFWFHYEALPRDPTIFIRIGRRSFGYNRQIFSSFLMDLFVSTDVIAWMDTDVKFTTPITRDNIFTNGKLKAKGMSTFEYTPFWSETTKLMVGHGMMSDFMTYFPVFIWTDTVKNCRKHILKHMNVSSIETAFMKTKPWKDLSPVNVIMTYAYYYERDRYDWHIDTKRVKLDEYNAEHVTPGSELTAADVKPEVHVSLHDKFYKDPDNTANKKSFCFAIMNTSLFYDLAQNIKQMCKQFKNDIMWELFIFSNDRYQDHLETWCKDDRELCIKLIDEQYSKVHKLIEDGVYTLDFSKLTAVENSALDMGVRCSPYF